MIEGAGYKASIPTTAPRRSATLPFPASYLGAPDPEIELNPSVNTFITSFLAHYISTCDRIVIPEVYLGGDTQRFGQRSSRRNLVRVSGPHPIERSRRRLPTAGVGGGRVKTPRCPPVCPNAKLATSDFSILYSRAEPRRRWPLCTGISRHGRVTRWWFL